MSATATTNLSIQREFLGWNDLALPNAARRLGTRYCKPGTLDLSRVIVVVPGQRAGRRLQELLAFFAEDEKLRFTPPTVVTEGRLPEMLYTPKLPFANDLVQDLAWATVLRALPADKLFHLVPHPPDSGDLSRWLDLGKIIRRLHVELAADGLDFAAIQRKGPNLASFDESKRWETLATVQRLYLELLDKQKLWDIQTARLKAIEFHEIATECDIVLLGTVDLNDSLRQMLDQIAASVTAYIIAPEELAERFDAHGCLVSSAWSEAAILIHDEQIRQVDGPGEQAEAVTEWLAELDGRFRTDEVVIGVPDQSLVQQLQRELDQSNVPARWVEGVRIAHTGPYRLLDAAVRFAGSRRYDDLASLLRHPDFEDRLQPSAVSLPAQLDLYYNTHLPSRFGAASTLATSEDWPDLAHALERINVRLQGAAKSQTLRSWGNIFREILGAVYGRRTLDLDAEADAILHKTMLLIIEACDRLKSVPEELDTVPLDATDAFRIVLGPVADETLPPASQADEIEILGWLELPLDDSPALIVTSFNEGFVPQSAGADNFLPDRLRRELGVLHNERRYARDAYATSVLCHCRAELRFVFAKRDTNNDPRQPSRLLFACDDDTLVRRASQFFAERKAPSGPRRLLLARNRPVLEKSLFEVPRPLKSAETLSRFSVTRFKTYIACPYRYYLQHVRKLVAIDDASRELEGSAFGNLLHDTLSVFGRDADSPRAIAQEEVIFEFLDDRLHDIARQRFGAKKRRASIQLQIELARRRLRAFAAKQVELLQEGWRIIHAEAAEKDFSVSFEVDGTPIKLTGRIDRIDIHEASRKLRILDYKTADTAKLPEKTHRRGVDWIDLQLPLYRHLLGDPHLAKLPKGCEIELGYFNLPKEIEQTNIALAPWDSQALAAADEMAQWVIRRIRGGNFWPPVSPPPEYSEDFAAICLDNVLRPPTHLNEED